jgi:hypothetical protein
MAQLSEPDWLPAKDNPLPEAVTTVTFTVAPELVPNGGVRITYELSDPAISFKLPSPGPGGSTPVNHSANKLVDDHTGLTTGSQSITRTLTLVTAAKPARTKLTVTVADVVGSTPTRENHSSDQITFFVV